MPRALGVDALAEEPALEAVTIDRAQQKISPSPRWAARMCPLTERITAKFRKPGRRLRPCVFVAQRPGRLLSCTGRCPRPEQNKITIRDDGPTTTIARVTCPTAPKFCALGATFRFPSRPARRRISRKRRAHRRTL